MISNLLLTRAPRTCQRLKPDGMLHAMRPVGNPAMLEAGVRSERRPPNLCYLKT